jgi:hypothetical protein
VQVKPTKLDKLLIWSYPIFAGLFSLAVPTNFFVSIIIFFLIPSVYLSVRYPRFIKKVFLFSLTISIPFIVGIDYVMERTGGWVVPYSIFGMFRIAQFVTVDIILWSLCYVYFVVMFYKVFVETKKMQEKTSPHLKLLALLSLGSLTTFSFLYLINPSILYISYFYLKFGIVLGLLPVVLVLFRFPKLNAKFAKVGLYFFVLSFIQELTALKYDHWSFPNSAQFIGTVQFLNFTFPFEELFFWIILGSFAMLSYFEFFDDDRK